MENPIKMDDLGVLLFLETPNKYFAANFGIFCPKATGEKHPHIISACGSFGCLTTRFQEMDWDANLWQNLSGSRHTVEVNVFGYPIEITVCRDGGCCFTCEKNNLKLERI